MDWKAQLGNWSPELIKTVLALLGAWLLHRLTTKNADLISYMSQVQTVNVPAQGQVPAGVVHTLHHPNTVYVALNEIDAIVGYWHFVPLFEKEYRRLRRGRMSINEITSDRIPVLELPGTYSMYFVIITVLQEYRYTKAIRVLFESFLDVLEELATRGIFFREVCADAYTPVGVTLCRKFGMKLLLTHPKRGEIYVRRVFPFPKDPLISSRHELGHLYYEWYSNRKTTAAG